jgi:hypothetical protein
VQFVPVAPAMSMPLRCHRYVKGGVPTALAVKATAAPTWTVSREGSIEAQGASGPLKSASGNPGGVAANADEGEGAKQPVVRQRARAGQMEPQARCSHSARWALRRRCCPASKATFTAHHAAHAP